MNKLTPGITKLIEENHHLLKNKKIAIVCNQASVTETYHHIIFRMIELQSQFSFEIKAVFGPQHGVWGHTQDNMIEWESYRDSRFPFPFYSLYGQRRDIAPELLQSFDTIIFDIQDVGARYYTFIWTLALIMKSIQKHPIHLIVTDRPNPINGIQVEGPVLDPHFSSFVGLHPLPIRHGMTIGEIAHYFKAHFYPDTQLTVIPMEGWDRSKYLDQFDEYPWVFPSPNMPSINTAVVYPGLCLLEGTNISEGRGTTRPFEIFGAPFIDGIQLCEYLNNRIYPHAYFRFQAFEPTFNKFKGHQCEGSFIHVLDRTKYKPFFTGVFIIHTLLTHYKNHFQWKNPPYEYEYHKLPIDILFGNGYIRKMLEDNIHPDKIEKIWQKELDSFLFEREKFLLYK